MIRPTRSSSSFLPPGFGSAWWTMWRLMSIARSATQTGWFSRKGTLSTRRPNGGSRSSRARTSSAKVSMSMPPGRSRIATFTVCMCIDGVSM